ncbi:hypothetical protein BDN71DRAFT_486070 [Pleurotus eryngii]|uniref:Uncharacterized protein n=1 Tax=Pleurotus eryngii TaxID=5323 RepID=A0A9P6A7V0_PLEER|nr:hypothetical protein BDN71DRAFT_486070 [Pleurotus eryngii]
MYHVMLVSNTGMMIISSHQQITLCSMEISEVRRQSKLWRSSTSVFFLTSYLRESASRLVDCGSLQITMVRKVKLCRPRARCSSLFCHIGVRARSIFLTDCTSRL